MNKLSVVILAGGKGTRLAEETLTKPKPMVNVGKKPIISHIIDIYRTFGSKNFYIAGGYKHEIIKNFFKKKNKKNLNINVINTGKNTQTGGRIFKLKKFLQKDMFFLTYGDGLSDIDIRKLLKFHIKNKKEITMTVVQPPPRWGFVKMKNNLVKEFKEKDSNQHNWINGGFMIINPSIFKNYSFNDKTIFESDILPKVVKNKQLAAFKHYGFWQCMDTLRDKIMLNKLSRKNPPWKK
jgi:glucose-1-phosphate cytidylyltransferase